MVFQIVALLFLVVNGAKAPEPIGDLRVNMSFPTQAECEAYLASAAGTVIKANVTGFFNPRGMDAIFSCVEHDDNSI